MYLKKSSARILIEEHCGEAKNLEWKTSTGYRYQGLKIKV